ncbi:hypothetical protein SPHINGOR109_51036 [Sphingorhabdus sp. 109]|nr:hypothetical protein SPHINGOR109_51036 [Sphingorhabdus sp. 109]
MYNLRIAESARVLVNDEMIMASRHGKSVPEHLVCQALQLGLPKASGFGNGARLTSTMLIGILSWGRLAQLVERFVYTEDVGGSSPSSPTIIPIEAGDGSLVRFTLSKVQYCDNEA